MEIHLYGKLRRYAKQARPSSDCAIVLEPGPGETIASLLVHMGIPVDEINHIFFNSKLLASRSSMAPFMGYLQARSNLYDWNLNVPINNGDRIGLFGADMAVLGM
jgi:hypothetical protein